MSAHVFDTSGMDQAERFNKAFKEIKQYAKANSTTSGLGRFAGRIVESEKLPKLQKPRKPKLPAGYDKDKGDDDYDTDIEIWKAKIKMYSHEEKELEDSATQRGYTTCCGGKQATGCGKEFEPTVRSRQSQTSRTRPS